MHGHSGEEQAPLHGGESRSLRHFLGTPLAHDGVSAVARVHSRARQGAEERSCPRLIWINWDDKTRRAAACFCIGCTLSREASKSSAPHQVSKQQFRIHLDDFIALGVLA